jgi:alkyl sulfatase BDS1-like metallo-beta-lactamase superfamily hydrolase
MTENTRNRFDPLPEPLAGAKPATAYTMKKNRDVLAQLPFEDRQAFEDAGRGFIASIAPVTITRPSDGKKIYDLSSLSFLFGEAPDTVNPSLWRQAQLNAENNGLFEVVDGIYQVRSFDLGHMTLVRGETGWIVIDPLTSAESAKAALALANEQLGPRPVVAVIYTHSHVDHFAGVHGVIDPADAVAGKVSVIAPDQFVMAALSENVVAGNVMRRRAIYMYGNILPHSPKGFVSNGLGALLSMGTTGFIAPTDIVQKTGEKRVVDGVEIVFQMAPDAEAVSEFVFFFPQFHALCMSEITSHHLHNVYTPRGAQIRDALAWANHINKAVDLFGDMVEVLFASHHWPVWGRARVKKYLKQQRDLYKYIHDQTVRLANHGYTKEEIAERLTLPESLSQNFSNRDYYGTLSHNAKAVYVKYLGYFDGNPATLNPLPPEDAAKRYVEYMGGLEAVTEKARQSFEQGEYRWVAQVMNHAVMSDPDNTSARALLADALEQMGYQAESGPWRNFYLTGAMELRRGEPAASPGRISKTMVSGMPLENVFQALAVRLNGPKAAGKRFAFNINFTDFDTPWLMTVENAVLNSFPGRQDPQPTTTLTLSQMDFKLLMTGLSPATDLMASGRLKLEGDMESLADFSGLLDQFNQHFPIVTSRKIQGL